MTPDPGDPGAETPMPVYLEGGEWFAEDDGMALPLSDEVNQGSVQSDN